MKLKRPATVLAVVLAGVFVALGVCVALTIWSLSGNDWIVFTVINHSGKALKHVEVTMDGKPQTLADIETDGHGRLRASILAEGSPHLKYSKGGAVYDVDLDMYVSPGLGGHAVNITVNADKLKVQDPAYANVHEVSAKPDEH
jgi:hypothetical protein